MCSAWKLSNQLGFGLGNICGNVLDIDQHAVNDNPVNRFHFQLGRWDTKYKERSHILSEYLLLDNVKLMPSGLLKDFEYEINISSSPQAKPSPSRPSLQHKTDIHSRSLNTIWYLNLIIFDPPCPSSLSLPDTVLVLFAETCFYSGVIVVKVRNVGSMWLIASLPMSSITFTTITTTIKTCFREQDQHRDRQGQRAGPGRGADN